MIQKRTALEWVWIEVYCSCYCHHKKGEVLESVGGPVANTIRDVQPFSVGDTIDNG
jgi:hypothetical protein